MVVAITQCFTTFMLINIIKEMNVDTQTTETKRLLYISPIINPLNPANNVISPKNIGYTTTIFLLTNTLMSILLV